MQRRSVPAILSEILRASIPTPIALASAGCGGTTSDQAAAVCSTPPLEGGALEAVAADAASACMSYTLPVTGDAAACGLFPVNCDDLSPGPATSANLCAALCHQWGASCWLVADNGVHCVAGMCAGGACCGRRPAGLALGVASGESVVGRWFAELAAREAASVEAFAILRAELAFHRAPRRLVAGAQRAARDEVRHARVVSALASRYGGTPRPPRFAPRTIRSLEAIATENAVEGCVRETFGALVGMWQARFAKDERVRKAMIVIARDETRHATLSWQVASWIEPRVSASARRRLQTARRAAIAELKAEIACDPAADIVHHAGVPSARAAGALLAQACEALWRPSRKDSGAPSVRASRKV